MKKFIVVVNNADMAIILRDMATELGFNSLAYWNWDRDEFKSRFHHIYKGTISMRFDIENKNGGFNAIIEQYQNADYREYLFNVTLEQAIEALSKKPLMLGAYEVKIANKKTIHVNGNQITRSEIENMVKGWDAPKYDHVWVETKDKSVRQLIADLTSELGFSGCSPESMKDEGHSIRIDFTRKFRAFASESRYYANKPHYGVEVDLTKLIKLLTGIDKPTVYYVGVHSVAFIDKDTVKVAGQMITRKQVDELLANW